MRNVQKPKLRYPQDITKVLDLWNEGNDTKDISIALMVSESDVYNFMARIGR